MGATSSSYPESRVVTTKYGKVLGRRLINEGEKQVDAFQGIPFAKPPVGELRFKKPVPPEPWDGVKHTTKWAPRAIQKDFFLLDHFRKGAPSEDCLYLNVFTPAWKPPPGGFPVMVYIHGGAFIMDGAMSYGDTGICQHLCMKDVVVVSVQYRLAYLGFFTTGDEVCPGNLGLWDQTEALRWVQENIAAFDGNKDNVTIFGQSAGGASVDLLHLSPKTKGLFHKIIPMAGTIYAPWSINHWLKQQCEKKAKQLLGNHYTENSEELIKRLRALPAMKFAVPMFQKKEKGREVELECTPTMDGDFLPEPFDILRKKAPSMPMMTGVANLEGLLFMIWSTKASPKRLHRFFQKAVPEELHDREEITKEFMLKYIDLTSKPSTKEIFRAENEIFSDWFMAAPTLELARDTQRVQGDQAPVYNYIFKHFNPKNWGVFRFTLPIVDASHCTELSYLFGKGVIWPFHYTEEDKKMLDMFTTAFTNFAKYSDPNGASPSSTDLPVRWDPLTTSNPETHYIFDLHPECRKDAFFDGKPAEILRLHSRL